MVLVQLEPPTVASPHKRARTSARVPRARTEANSNRALTAFPDARAVKRPHVRVKSPRAGEILSEDSAMSESPVKRSAEDVPMGVRTPEDASPEASISTPAYRERSSGKKRGRAAKEDGVKDDARESSGQRATRSRGEVLEQRILGLRARVKMLCGRLATAKANARRARCERDARNSDQEAFGSTGRIERRRSDRGV